MYVCKYDSNNQQFTLIFVITDYRYTCCVGAGYLYRLIPVPPGYLVSWKVSPFYLYHGTGKPYTLMYLQSSTSLFLLSIRHLTTTIFYHLRFKFTGQHHPNRFDIFWKDKYFYTQCKTDCITSCS